MREYKRIKRGVAFFVGSILAAALLPMWAFCRVVEWLYNGVAQKVFLFTRKMEKNVFREVREFVEKIAGIESQ